MTDLDKKKEGFSYVSPEVQNRNARIALIIEVVIIIVIVVGLFFFLNLFGIFPIGRLMPSLVGRAPSDTTQNVGPINPNEPPQVLTPTPFAYDKNAKPSVEVISDISGYSITLQNQDKLLQLLNSWGVYDKNYGPSYGVEGNTLEYPLKRIIIRLTDKDQQTNGFATPQKVVYSSCLTNASPGMFVMHVYMSKDALESTRQSFLPANTFQGTFLTSLYRAIHPSKSGGDEVFAQFKDNSLMTLQYFVIKKN